MLACGMGVQTLLLSSNHACVNDLVACACAVFKGAHVLTNSEMRFLLNGHINAKKQKNPAYEPPSVMQRTMDYVNKFACGKNEEVMREIRRCSSCTHAFRQGAWVGSDGQLNADSSRSRAPTAASKQSGLP